MSGLFNTEDSATTTSRRSFVKGGLVVAAGTALGAGSTATAAQSTTQGEEDAEKANFLFVQSAKTATLADGVLTLENVAPTTLFFTDRPVRTAGHFETDQFVVAMMEDTQVDSFNADPPNATLSVFDGEFVTNVAVVLKEPTINGHTITFPVEILDGPEELKGGPASLFIDPIGRPLSPVSIAGVHRRHRRRRRRYAVRH